MPIFVPGFPLLIATLLLGFSAMLYGQAAEDSDASMSGMDALSAQDRASEPGERVWLAATGSKQLAFYLNEKSGTAHGGVLIVPDRGIHPIVSGTINALRHTLAQHHWHTLAVNISSLNTEQIQQTIAAGIRQLNAKGVFNIAILGEGEGAAHALHYIAGLPPVAEGEIQQIRALIMLNAHNTASGLEQDAMAPLATLKLPVLDAYVANDFREAQQAQERRALTNNSKKLYQQARVPYVTVQSPDQENRVTKRIRGWLDKNVAGFMVDSKGN